MLRAEVKQAYIDLVDAADSKEEKKCFVIIERLLEKTTLINIYGILLGIKKHDFDMYRYIAADVKKFSEPHKSVYELILDTFTIRKISDKAARETDDFENALKNHIAEDLFSKSDKFIDMFGDILKEVLKEKGKN